MQNHARASFESEYKTQNLRRNAAIVPHRENRRDFLTNSLAAIGLVVASFIGLDQLIRTSESLSPKTIHTEMAADFATFDAAYSTLGRNKIETFASSHNDEIARRTIRWIQSRGHTSMYDLICIALMSPKPQINLHAFNIIEKIDPVDLKSQKSLISDLLKQTQNEFLRRNLPTLLSVIESS